MEISIMKIQKAIEILESGLITQQEQEEFVTVLQNIQKMISGLVDRVNELEAQLRERNT
jgi:hypothetical protein